MALLKLPRTFHLLLVGTLINRMGGFVVPFLSLYLVQMRGLRPTEAGMIVSLFGLGGMGAGFLGGTIADRIGRKPALLLGLWGGALAMATLGTLQDPRAIGVGCFFLGLIGESYRPAVFATVADILPAEQRLLAFGYLYQAVNLGFAIALPMAGLLFKIHPAWMFGGDALTSALCGLVLFWGVPETLVTAKTQEHRKDPGYGPLLKDPHLLLLLLLTLPLAFGLWQNGITLPLHLSSTGFEADTYGWLMAINGVMIVLAQPWVTQFLRRFPRPVAYCISCTLYAVGFMLQAVVGSVAGFAGTVVLWTLGEMSNTPINSTTLADLAPNNLRARYQGAFNTLWGLAAAGGPALAGWLWESFGGESLWLCVGLSCAIAAAVHLAVGPARERAVRSRQTG